MNTEILRSIVNDYKLCVKEDEMAQKYGFTAQGMRSFCHGLFVIGIISDAERRERIREIKSESLNKTMLRRGIRERDEEIRKLLEQGESVRSIAQKFSVSEFCIYGVMRRNGYKRGVRPYPDSLMQSLFKEKDMMNHEMCWGTVREIISELPVRNQLVILEKYKNGKTYKEIGESLGVSKQFAQDICKRSFKKILKQYEIKTRRNEFETKNDCDRK